MPYSITTKDGITIDNIPDDVDPQSPELKQRVAAERAKLQGAPVGTPVNVEGTRPAEGGISIEQTATTPIGGETMPGQLPQQAFVPEPVPAQPAQEMGFLQKVGDLFTGASRETKESQTLPEWTTMPELNTLTSMASAKTGLGTILSSPDETVKIIQANFPNTQVRKDAKGNWVLRSSIDGKEYVIPPGFSIGDIPRALAGLGGFSVPGGMGASIPRSIAGAAKTQAVIEGTQAATGGEYNPADVLMAGSVGGAGAGIAQGIGAAAKPITEALKRIKEGGMPIGTPINVTASRLPPAGQFGSMGSAGVEPGALRQAKANELPYPIPLTTGQKTRNFGDVQFEREAAKILDVGEPLRERYAAQNLRLQQNLDAFIDMTGSERRELRDVGLAVDEAVRKRMARDKVKIRSLYAEADKSGETMQPVTLHKVVDYLTENEPEAEVANVLKAARAKALKLGIAKEDDNGNLIAQPVTLRIAETFRKTINNATNADPVNKMQAANIKNIIDDSTEGMGGDIYKRARAARSRYAKDYENIGIISDLVSSKKGSSDRKVALENVLNRSVISPSTSLDDMRQLRRILHTEGEHGMQAWKELQGATLQHIKDAAMQGVAKDVAGNTPLSPAQLNRVISQLDKSGKLDFMFGKKGAEQLRLINDVAQDILTVPAGSVNTSNTASTLMNAIMDMNISAAINLPTPVLTTFKFVKDKIKDKKLRKRIQNVLEGK